MRKSRHTKATTDRLTSKLCSIHSLPHTPFAFSWSVEAGKADFTKGKNGMLGAEAAVVILELSDRAATGDKQAAQELFNLAHMAVNELGVFAREHPDIARDIAQNLPQWPVMASPNPDCKQENERLLKNLDVGGQSEINVAASTKWNRHNSATLCALEIHSCLDRNRRMSPWFHDSAPQWARDARKLPPLRKAVIPQWWKLGKLALLDSIPHPETHDRLAHLGREETEPSRQRARILWRIKRAFEGIARK